jgi:hypothetical protein
MEKDGLNNHDPSELSLLQQHHVEDRLDHLLREKYLTGKGIIDATLPAMKGLGLLLMTLKLATLTGGIQFEFRNTIWKRRRGFRFRGPKVVGLARLRKHLACAHSPTRANRERALFHCYSHGRDVSQSNYGLRNKVRIA